MLLELVGHVLAQIPRSVFERVRAAKENGPIVATRVARSQTRTQGVPDHPPDRSIRENVLIPVSRPFLVAAHIEAGAIFARSSPIVVRLLRHIVRRGEAADVDVAGFEKVLAQHLDVSEQHLVLVEDGQRVPRLLVPRVPVFVRTAGREDSFQKFGVCSGVFVSIELEHFLQRGLRRAPQRIVHRHELKFL